MVHANSDKMKPFRFHPKQNSLDQLVALPASLSITKQHPKRGFQKFKCFVHAAIVSNTLQAASNFTILHKTSAVMQPLLALQSGARCFLASLIIFAYPLCSMTHCKEARKIDCNANCSTPKGREPHPLRRASSPCHLLSLHATEPSSARLSHRAAAEQPCMPCHLMPKHSKVARST